MGYKALIRVGKAQTGSIDLPNKQSLSNYVKRNPLGNYKTKIEVTNTKTGRIARGSKLHFSNPNFWDI